MSDYETLLKRAQQKISLTSRSERFQMPEAVTSVQGNVTVIVNFSELVRTLRREPKHLMKFLLRELAVPGEVQGARASFQGRFTAEQIAGKLEKYANEYVFCACGKPDTELIKEGNVTRLKCQACGTKRVVRDLG